MNMIQNVAKKSSKGLSWSEIVTLIAVMSLRKEGEG